MGEASRRKKEGREVKDPLRFRRANIERFTREEAMFAAAYHKAKERREEEQKAFDVASLKLAENGHPLYAPQPYPVAPETGSAPEASASEVPAEEVGGAR